MLILNSLAALVTIIVATLGAKYSIFQGIDVFGLTPAWIMILRIGLAATLIIYYNLSFARGASLTPGTVLFFIHFVTFGAIDWMAFVNARPDSLLIPNMTCLARMGLGGFVFWIWIEDQLEDSFASRAWPGRQR